MAIIKFYKGTAILERDVKFYIIVLTAAQLWLSKLWKPCAKGQIARAIYQLPWRFVDQSFVMEDDNGYHSNEGEVQNAVNIEHDDDMEENYLLDDLQYEGTLLTYFL